MGWPTRDVLEHGELISMYSLWRGGVLLGWFTEHAPVTHHGARVGASGVLQPTESFAETSSVMQTRASMLPGRPVFQVSLDATRQEARTRAPGEKPGMTVALKPLSDEEARGIPAELVLEVRGEDGTRIDAAMVTLDRRSDGDELPGYWLVAFSTGADRAPGEEP
jgi:hypothetical protein